MSDPVTFAEVMERVAQIFEVLGTLVLVAGVLWSTVLTAVVWRRSRRGQAAYESFRESFGGALLLAVEIFVAADLIRTVAVAPTLENVTALGLIVLIRTFLSFSLEIEIEGVPPWRRALVSGITRTAEAADRHLRPDRE